MRFDPARLPVIDALKAIACQLIVLHHLAFYGPMSDTSFLLAPDLFTSLSRYGRMAVQIFLVISGFLVARHLLANHETSYEAPPPFWKTIGKRYLRLVVPYSVALIVALLAAGVARSFIEHDSIPVSPTFNQFLLHLLLLQDILDIEALSAGTWYVAIDFQLFLVTVSIIGLCRCLTGNPASHRFLSLFFLIVLGLGSLFYFNRDESFDGFFLYFFIYYVIGIISYLLARCAKPQYAVAGILSMAAVIFVALNIDFRVRLIVALCTAIILIISFYIKELNKLFNNRLLNYLGQISYSVFLIHFPICLVVNTFFHYWFPDRPWLNFLGIFVAWGSSMACGALFFRYVERNVFRRKLSPLYVPQP